MATLIPKVSFQNGGTTPSGAVNRPINQKVQDFVSVKDFGATGDGTTNDTLSIEAAIGFCRGTGSGATLYFPAGTYCFSETTPGFGLYINQPLMIVGDGINKTILKNLSATGAGLRFGVGYTSASDLTLNQNNSTGVAFRVNGEYSSYSNIQIKNQTGTDASLVVDGATLSTFSNISIANTYNGISVGPTLPTNYVRFEQCTVGGATNIAVKINTGSNIRFDGLTTESDAGIALAMGPFIQITNSNQVDFYSYTSEDGNTNTLAGNEYIKIDGSKNINFHSGYINHHGQSARAIFGIGGSGSGSVNIRNIYYTDNSAGSMKFVESTGNFTGLIVSNIYSFSDQVFTAVKNTAQPTSQIIENLVDGNAGSSLDLAGPNILVTNYSGGIAVGAGANHTFINCTGAFTGAGVPTASLLDKLIVNPNGVFVSPTTDNTCNLGTATSRWAVVYAGTGTINTSDEREKQDIQVLSEAEKQAAIAIKGLIRSFKFKDAVAKKGDDARIHVGVMAQQVAEAFKIVGLNPDDYALFCYDEWSAQLDNLGNEISPAGNRYGIRYDELLAFVISAL
jgi:hypothetical protein